MRKPPPLYAHQGPDIQFELDNDRVFDTSDAGTGKTRARLEAFSKRRANGAGCALILATKSLLRAAWENDVKKFTPWLRVQCCYAATRAQDFGKDADMYVTNHDAVKWLAKQPPAFFKKFDSLVIDESSAFKHHTSDRSRALNKIKKYFKFRTLMTGTPNTNSVTDLWNQAYVLDDGKRLGQSFYAFRAAVQIPKQVGPKVNMVKWEDRDGAEASVGALLKDITIRHTFDECHSIPANHNYIVPYVMSGKHMKVYEDMERDKIALLKTGHISAINAASVMTKLLQIASGAVYDENDNYHLVDTSRYELIADLIEGRKFCVCFFLWRHQKEQLIKEFGKRGITHTLIDGSVTPNKRLEAVNFFQNGFYKVLLAHPKSAAHGLTLTKGTSTIWASPTYDLEWWLQGYKRIYRAGQTLPTETVNVIAEGTIEERVYNVLTKKNAKMSDLLGVLT